MDSCFCYIRRKPGAVATMKVLDAATADGLARAFGRLFDDYPGAAIELFVGDRQALALEPGASRDEAVARASAALAAAAD